MWLIGMMGSGKTTVGSALAQRLGVPFYDTDQIVTGSAGESISEIFAHGGEDRFRRLERDAVMTVSAEDSVVAVGGGAVLDPNNRARMSASPPVVWLRCAPDTLARRLDRTRDRPLLPEGDDPVGRLAAILGDRRALYEGVADHVIDTDALTVAEAIEELRHIWSA